MTGTAPRVALVDGDVTIDWNIAHTRRHAERGASWNPDDATRIYPQAGGAALLAQLIGAIARQLEDADGPHWRVEFAAGPPSAPTPGDGTLHHSYSVWTNHGGTREAPVWRVEEFLGLDPKIRQDAPATQEGQARSVELVVLDDAALGFRDEPDTWPAPLRIGKPWVVLKMSNPIGEGRLFDFLQHEHRERLGVILTIDDLRRSEVQISRELSWEKTAEDLAWELTRNPLVNGLSRCMFTAVTLDAAGAFLLRGGQGTLFFDPRYIERTWRDAHRGSVIGYTTCVAAALVRHLMLAGEGADLAAAVQSGIAAMRALHRRGYGADGATTALMADLKFPTEAIAAELASAATPCTAVEVRMAADSPGAATNQPRRWSILEQTHAGDFTALAARIVVDGTDAALPDVPHGAFGKLLTVDRLEIEGLRAIRAIMLEYWRRGASKPLSIAVFGTPGSGKSFGVSQVASSLLPDVVETRSFNLSQFSGADELQAAFHQVRDVGLAGKLPLVFWDEFDTALGDQRLGWLRHFLAPMQDGVFQQGEVTHPIGRAIFVFAGGTQPSMESFAGLASGPARLEFQAAKGPDFVSRLKGFLNVAGPNPRASGADAAYVIRRAILLRLILEREAPRLFQQTGKMKRLAIDRGVLRALLLTREYKHGARSLESLVAMSALSGKPSFSRSSLPPPEQLEIHVDANEFLSLVQQPELSGGLLERMARAAHDVWMEGKRRDGFSWGPVKNEPARQTPLLVDYSELPETFKESNRATVRGIPRKVAAAGYVMVPARGSEPPVSFPPDDLEMLAELEHELWMESRIADGWEPGAPDAEHPKRTPYLVPWPELDESIKESDRDLVKGIPRILAAAGYTLVRTAAAAPQPV